MSSKQFEIIIPNQTKDIQKSLQGIIQNAMLDALLEQKYITSWQYEQCYTKIPVSEISKSRSTSFSYKR